MSNEGIKKVFVTKLTDTSAKDLEGIGVLRFEGSRIFKWIKYNNGAGSVASVAGNCGYYFGDISVVLDSAAEVTMDLTDSDGIAAGIFQAIIADCEFGWIQIKGVAVMNIAFKAGVDGNAMTAVGAAVDGELDVAALVTDHLAGYAIDVSAKIILLDCPW